MRASPRRHSMPITPCAIAGSISAGSNAALTPWVRPRRFKPASASTMPSNSPRASFSSRVVTLPRRSRSSRSGRSASSWLRRRRLDVPTTAPCGRPCRPPAWLDSRQSRGSSRSSTTGICSSGGSSTGTSFMECTARSASPASIACSSSLMKRPLPPILASGVSRMRSPAVLITSSSIRSSGWAASSRALTCSACHSASRLPRVAMRTREGCDGVVMRTS